MSRPPLHIWRLIREVLPRYEDARYWWRAPNPRLDGKAPKDAHPTDVEALLHALADGVVF